MAVATTASVGQATYSIENGDRLEIPVTSNGSWNVRSNLDRNSAITIRGTGTDSPDGTITVDARFYSGQAVTITITITPSDNAATQLTRFDVEVTPAI